MRRLFSLLLASTMILVACGNASNENKELEDEKKSEVKKEAKKNNNKPKNEKKNQDINKNNNEQVQNANNNQPVLNNNSNHNNEQQNNKNNYTVIENGNKVTEIYNGQSFTTTNNPIREGYVEGETDPIYKREYKHFYTPEEAQRAQENSDQILREMGLEPERYE